MSQHTPNYATCHNHGEVETTTGIVNGELVDLCPLCEVEVGTDPDNLDGFDVPIRAALALAKEKP